MLFITSVNELIVKIYKLKIIMTVHFTLHIDILFLVFTYSL